MGPYWDGRSLYDRLEVEPSATTDEIKSAYRLLSSVWHPDKHSASFHDRCTQRLHGIHEAYETLSDTIRRERYDAKRAASTRLSRFCFGAVRQLQM